MSARLVLGTAGHIDHGKTALVRALTGVDTDRLPEEKARGITLDLGFAPLDLEGDLRLSVVDVPGHERLVRTMVAGATGIDLVLLVVAADEGVMPQTREHAAICELLGIARGVVALTKSDLVDEDVAALAAGEVRELLAGTALEGSPLVAVSSLTGGGLDALRAALMHAARDAEPRTPRAGPPRLAIDRAFAVRGFGSVVTGTLVGGALAVGDAVEIQPGGARSRVRGVQMHGAAARCGEPGVRCALNLQGIEIGELSRGQVVTLPGALAPTCLVDVALTWLDAAPACEGPTAVSLLAGTAERRARVAPIGEARLRPGGRGFARLHVDGPPLPLLPGDRFVLRGFGAAATGATLGGGVVLDVAPPRRRRSDPALRKDLAALARRDPRVDLRVRIRRSGLAGATRTRLRHETGLDDATLDDVMARLAADGEVCPADGALWLDAAAVASLEERVHAALARHHAEQPLRPGMPRAALRGCLPENAARAGGDLAVARLAERGVLRIEDDRVRLADHAPRLDPELKATAERLLAEARAAGLEPPSLREWCERLELAPGVLGDLLAHLEREGRLVRAPGDLWFDRAAVDALRERVRAHLREHRRLETPDYKALIGTSRRTAVPLMELFDAERLTRRSGDARVLRSEAG